MVIAKRVGSSRVERALGALLTTTVLSTAALVAGAITATPAAAQQTWDAGSATADFEDPVNWSNDTAPDNDNLTVVTTAVDPVLAAGGVDDGIITVNSLTITSGTMTVDATGNLTVTTSLAVNGGTFTQNGTASADTLSQTAGTINGTNAITVAGLFSQSGGTTGGTVDINSGTFTQSNAAIVAAGTTVTSTGAQSLQGGTIAGTLDGGGAVTVTTGTTTLSGSIAGALSVTVTSGALTETGAGSIDTSTNTILVNGGALTAVANGIANDENVTVSSGSYTVGGADTIASLSVSGTGTATANAALTVTGNLTQSGGTVNGNSTIGAAAFNQSGGTTGGTVDINVTTFTQSGGATVAAGTSVTSSGAQSLQGGTIAGSLDGAGAITAASGTTGVSGTITNAASLTVSGGTVNLTGAGSVDTSTNVIGVSAGALTDDGNGIADDEVVIVSGTGTLTITGTDTVAALSQSGGTINGSSSITATGAFAQSGGTTGGTVDINAATFTQSGGAVIAAGTSVTSAGAQSLQGGQILGALDGAGAVSVTTATTSVTGAGTISSTTIGISGAGNLTTDGDALAAGATVTVTGGTAVFNLGGGTETITGVTLAGGTVQNGTLNAPITSTGGTVSGIGGSASLTANSGTTTLTGTNGYTGTTTVNNTATVIAGNANAFSNASATTVNNGGIFDLGGAAQSVASISLAGGTVRNGSLTGAISSTGGFIANIGGSASVATTAGTTSISGTNGYTGTTNVGFGSVLFATSANAFSASSAHTVNGALDLGGFSQAIGSLAGTTGIVGTSVATAATLTTGGDNTSTLYAGTIVNAAATVSLIKVGTGTMTLSNAGNTYSGPTSVNAGGLTVSGALTASAVTVASGATLTLLNGGDLGSTVNTNAGSTTLVTGPGSSVIGALFTNGGSLTVDAGATLTATAGGLTNQGTGTILNNGTINDVFNNAGGATNNFVWNADVINTGSIFNNGTWNTQTAAGINNSGSWIAGNLSIISGPGGGNFINNGAGIYNGAAGSSTVAGAFTNNGVVTMNDSDTQDVVNIGGDWGGNGTVRADVVLSGAGAGGASLGDKIVVAGNFTGNTTFNFTNIAPGGATNLQPDILVADLNNVQANPGTFTASGLPAPGLVSYQLVKNAAGDLVIRSSGDLTALGGLAGSVAVVQSTLGAIINRPSSPFVSGLAADVEPNHCGPGVWMRETGGAVQASSVSTSPNQPSATSTVSLAYAGAQFGLDLACFNVKESGVDVAGGLIAGANTGVASQPISAALGTTNSSFQQGYGGIYATVAKGAFSADLQVRADFTTFTFSNPVPQVELNNTTLNTVRGTVSGSASYAFQMNDTAVVPTVGFSVSQTNSSVLTFTSGRTLTPAPSLSLVGFTGLTVAKTIVLPDEVSAVQPFGTATVYNDFAPYPTATFGDPASPGFGQVITSSHLGMIGEVSLGANFFHVFEAQEGKPRQVNATVRVDGRFNSVLLGAGITGQVRAQF